MDEELKQEILDTIRVYSFKQLNDDQRTIREYQFENLAEAIIENHF